MKKIYLSLITAFFLITGSFAQPVVVLGADAATTLGNPYTTLKAAFDKINLVSQATNVIVITVTGVTTETAPAVLNQSVGPWLSLNIVPLGASQITGNIAGPLVDLNGADFVTIDGLNLAGNSLAINNSDAGSTSSTIRFRNDASNNTLTNVNILGSAGNTSGIGLGVVFFSTGSALGNDNNTINQCIISASSGGTPLNGIYSLGTSAVIDNSSNNISVCNISDYFCAFNSSNGININSNNSKWTIINNTFYQTATRTYTSAGTHNGIFITSGSEYTISNNFIGYSAPNQTGTTNMIGSSSGSLGGTFPGSFTVGNSTAVALRYNGINCAFTAGGPASSIQNNTIGGIALYSSSNVSTGSGVLCGIAVTAGNANIITNTIGSASGTGSLYLASTSAGAVVSGIYVFSSDNVGVQFNTIGAIDVSGTSATTAAGFKGIEVSSAGAGIFTVFTNTIGNSTVNNIRTGYLLTAGNLSNTADTPTPASGISAFNAIMQSGSTGNIIALNDNILQGFLISGTATTFTGISNVSSAANISINIFNNQLGSVSAGFLNLAFANSGFVTGIHNANLTAVSAINIINNTMQGISCVSSGNFACVNNNGSAINTINIKDNQFGTASGDLITYSAAMISTVREIFTSGGTGTCVLTIQNNSIRGIVHAVAATSFHVYISNTAGGLASANILGNTFINLNVNTTGNVTFIADAGFLGVTGTSSCSNNTITTAFNKSGASGSIFIYTSGGNNVNGSTMTETGNNFSNMTMSGTGTFIGWQNVSGVSSANGPTRTITGNTFNNISAGSGAITAMIVNVGGPTNCSSNIISNISGTGSITAISIGSANGQGTHNYSSNTISSLISTGTGGNVTGITGGISGFLTTVLNISNNSISVLSSTGASSSVEGIRINNANSTSNVNDNLVNNLTASGITSPQVAGIVVGNSTTVNVFKNKVTSLGVSAALTTVLPSVIGLNIIGGIEVVAYNNFIADLNAPSTNCTDAIQGIRVENSIPGSNHTILYNSVYINAGSTRPNFGTTGIWHLGVNDNTWGVLQLINNIIVNTSTANGTGFTVAYRRSNTFLANYAVGSDYNLFYAGPPAANRLIYYDGTNADQTLAAYQTRVSPRDANSISLMPAFTSATDLHLTPVNCRIDGRGIPVAGITDDIDLAARNATTPDIGADEFTATTSTNLAGVAGTAVCEDRTIAVTGTTYTNNACELIARVVPSGASPVAGKVNVCVTKDVSQLFFNSEPYVQRHYDLEPVTSNQTTTSATITLYFTDGEFALYNTNNPAWPKLPTIASGGMASPFIGNVKVTQFHGTPTGGLPTSTPGNYTGSRVLLASPVLALNGSIWSVTISIAGFSGFYVHTNITNTALPIIVNYLTGRRQGSNHLLNWKVTCATSPRASMTLERSADSRNFTDLYSITADAARCNQPFDYTDANPLIGMNYYRLKIVDADGKVTYSTTVALLNAVKGFDIISIAPNPVVADNFKLNVTSAQAGKIEIAIFDMQGRFVNRQSSTLIAGYNSLPVKVANLASGTYTIKASMAGDQSKVIRFVKQ